MSRKQTPVLAAETNAAAAHPIWKGWLALLLAGLLITGGFLLPGGGLAVAAETAEITAAINFGADAVTVSGSDSVTVVETAVTISAPGTYVLSGTCPDGQVTVAKNSGQVQLVLQGLELTCTTYCPLETKGGDTVVTITTAAGTVNTLSDTDRGEEKPKSAINASKAITLTGEGTLIVNGNNKNGIKSDTDVTVAGGTLQVNAKDNGISADNLLTVTGGIITVRSQGGDALCAKPDALTEETAGRIVISGGTLDLQADQDGIQAENEMTISGGKLTIRTGEGYTDTGFDSNTESAKGLKVSHEALETDTVEAANSLVITGGTFNLDCADDALHTDGYITITGGKFTIYTGDDGAHADTSLIIGEEGADDTSLFLEVCASYEGLEAGTVYLYAGTVKVTASDDGINSAGGSDTGEAMGGFNPGGGRPGRPGQSAGTSASSSDYQILIYGGYIYVNANGDGLDSNGNLTISGGTCVVFGQAANGENPPFDCDGTFTITGGTVFGAGSRGMASNPSSGSQSYVTSSSNITSGKTIHILDASGNQVFSWKAIKNVNYVLYSPAVSGYQITFDDAAWTQPAILDAPADPEDGGDSAQPTDPTDPDGGDASQPTDPTDPDSSDASQPTDPTDPDSSDSSPSTEPTAPDGTDPDPTQPTNPTDPDGGNPADPQSPLLGDMNEDGNLSVTDVVLLRKAILHGNQDPSDLAKGDMNRDSQLSVTDVVLLRKAILQG